MATIEQALRVVSDSVDRLQVERDRIAAERLRLIGLRAAGCLVGGALVCALDPGEFRTRADSCLAMLESVDRFVGEVIPVLERKAKAGDAKAAGDAVEACRRILVAVTGTQPFADFVVDVSTFVVDVTRDAKRAAGIGVSVGVVAAILTALYLLKRER